MADPQAPTNGKQPPEFVMVRCDLLRDRLLSPSAALVLGYLKFRQGGNGRCWPKIATIATELGLGIATVKRGVRRLVDLGLIEKTSPARCQANEYALSPAAKSEPRGDQNDTSRDQNDTLSGDQNDTSGAQNEPSCGIILSYPGDQNEPPIKERVEKNKLKRTKAEARSEVGTDGDGCLSELGLSDYLSEAGVGRAGATGRLRKPNPVWDEICRLWELHPVTKSDKSRVGKVARDFTLKLEAAGAELGEIGRRLERCQRAWSGIPVTPEALLKHWDTFKEDASGTAHFSSGQQSSFQKTGRRSARQASIDRGEYPEPDRPIPML